MSNLKESIRGYDILRESGELSKISDIKLALTNTKISPIDGKASKFIFGAGHKDAELIVRQYLLTRYVNLEFNKTILSIKANPKTKASIALPSLWLEIIAAQGIGLFLFKSKFLWVIYLINFFCKITLLLCRTIFDSLLQIFNMRKSNLNILDNNHSFFFSLTSASLPQPDQNGVSHDFISWYINWQGRNKDVKTLYHEVKGAQPITWHDFQIEHCNQPFQAYSTRKSLFKYSLWCFTAIFVSLWNLIIGRWWNLLMLEEAMHASYTKIQNTQMLAKEYYFNNSGWIYRPLWTYEAEKKGSAIHFYFYSTNCENISMKGTKADFYYGYQAMNWPHYLVWDDYQARFIRNAVGENVNISIVGPIWFSASSEELPALPNKTIAIFDVQPVRDAFYKTLGISYDYYIPKVCNQFLNDILAVIQSLNLSMALKRKREIGNKVHPSYRNHLKKIEKSLNFISINANISAIKLIDKSFLIISMPFTSTAILGRELNKPSIFYDPLNMLQKDDPAAHGIQIISGIDNLKLWVADNI